MQVFYFGCVGEPGHHLRAPDDISMRGHRTALREFERDNPWGIRKIDTGLCPVEEGQPQGRALLHYKAGWTAIAFWDRSVDFRKGSNSVFFAEGEHGFDEMLAIARQYFPQVMARFSYPITEVPSHQGGNHYHRRQQAQGSAA